MTLCISNGGQSAKNETNMNKINVIAILNRSAENPATTHSVPRINHGNKMVECCK